MNEFPPGHNQPDQPARLALKKLHDRCIALGEEQCENWYFIAADVAFLMAVADQYGVSVDYDGLVFAVEGEDHAALGQLRSQLATIIAQYRTDTEADGRGERMPTVW